MRKIIFVLSGGLFVSLFGLAYAGSNLNLLTVGSQHACVLAGGQEKCWGQNNNGQFGNGRTIASKSALNTGVFSGAISIVTGGPGVTCALVSPAQEAGIMITGNDVFCVGTNNYGLARANGSYNGMLTNPVKVNVWDYIFKKDNKGGYILDKNGKKIIIGKVGAEEIAIGGSHIIVRLASGTVKSWGEAWGSPKAFGALGRETNYAKKDAFLPISVAGFQNAVSVSAGAKFSCVVTSSGAVRCTGDNSSGQLGSGSKSAKSELPTDVVGINNAVVVTAGNQFACVLLSDGAVKCWGANSVGELGDGTFIKRTMPVSVLGLKAKVKVIDAGAEHVCALLDDSTVQCWGKNSSGQLGNGIVVSKVGQKGSNKPVVVSNLSAVTALSLGGDSSCALSGGDVSCWGDDTFGQLGDGKGLVLDPKSKNKAYLPVNSSVPVKVN